MPLSVDLNALATTLARYAISGGRFVDAAACRALHHVLADLADQAQALERTLAPPPPSRFVAGGNVVPLPPRRPAPMPPGGSAA